MNGFSINRLSFGSAVLLHFLFIGFAPALKAREPEPQEQIAIRFTSVNETVEAPAGEAPRREPEQAAGPLQSAPVTLPPVREVRQPSAPAPVPAPPQVPAPHVPLQQGLPAQQAPVPPPAAHAAARSETKAIAALPAPSMPETAEHGGRTQSAKRAVGGVPSPRLPDYLSVVRSMVENNREYPAMARQLGLQGTVTVRVSIRGDGSVGAVAVDVSSGHKALDKAAISAVRRSAPFKSPTGYGLGEVTVEIPIVYRLT